MVVRACSRCKVWESPKSERRSGEAVPLGETFYLRLAGTCRWGETKMPKLTLSRNLLPDDRSSRCSSSPKAGSNRDLRGDWIRVPTVVWATRHAGGLVLFRLSAMEQWFSKRGFRTKYSAQAGNHLDILSVESAQVGQKCQAWVGHRAVCLHTKSLGGETCSIYPETMPRLAEPPYPPLLLLTKPKGD